MARDGGAGGKESDEWLFTGDGDCPLEPCGWSQASVYHFEVLDRVGHG